MVRILTAVLALGVVLSSTSARADGPLAVNEDSVVSIGAETSLGEYEARVAVPGRGKLVATANADVFCAGDETARELVIDVNEAGTVQLDLCEDHLERRELLIRFVSE